MLKKILMIALLMGSSMQAMSAQLWTNSVFAEKGNYTNYSSITAGENKMSYACSVLKFNESKFAKSESIVLDLDLKLEEDKLAFQDEYKVSLIFSNGKMFRHTLSLTPNTNGSDKFKFFLSSKNGQDKEIIRNMQQRSYVNIEISDKKNKRMLYRFYLKDSMKSINKTKQECNVLYDTFK